MFQDPYASLDPRMRVGTILARAPRRPGHRHSARARREGRGAARTRSGLSPNAVDLYPHEFSGGQRQRIGLARALALDPKLIVADEPVSALDVSIQAQILNLMKELQQRHELTYIVISHDLAVVKYVADTIGVMYLGKLVEIGPCAEVYEHTAHPYTTGPDRHHSRARRRPGPGQAGGTHRGELPSAHQPAVGLPLPDPLPLRPGHLRRGRAAAAPLRDRPPRRVPLPAADAVGLSPRDQVPAAVG